MYEFETRAVHAGQDPSRHLEKRNAAISHRGKKVLYDSSALNSLEECIASLECAKYALCYPSGMAAVTSVTQILEDGDHAVLFDSIYHGTRTYLNICEELEKIEVTFVDLRDASILEKHLKKNTKMVWIETPCNPTMKIVDIKAIADILKKSHTDAFLVVDNTFMSPYFQNPLLHGADIVMHSLTKYMGGHSDVVMGAVTTSNDSLFAKLKETRDVIGTFPSPFDCYLVNRGLKTLHVRMERHMENALQVAKFLEQHEKIEKVYYPGLASHPQYELACKQCRGFSGMVSFRIQGGQQEAKILVENLKVFTLAVSLGSVESLIEIPSMMTAIPLSKEKREELDITDNLLRMSIGLESANDLIADLDQALQKVLCSSN